MLSYPAYANPTLDGEQGGDTEGRTITQTKPLKGNKGRYGGDNQQQQLAAQEIAAVRLQLEKERAYRNAKQAQYRTSNNTRISTTAVSEILGGQRMLLRPMPIQP